MIITWGLSSQAGHVVQITESEGVHHSLSHHSEYSFGNDIHRWEHTASWKGIFRQIWECSLISYCCFSVVFWREAGISPDLGVIALFLFRKVTQHFVCSKLKYFWFPDQTFRQPVIICSAAAYFTCPDVNFCPKCSYQEWSEPSFWDTWTIFSLVKWGVISQVCICSSWVHLFRMRMIRIKPGIPEASPVLFSIGISPSLLYVWYNPRCVYPTLILHPANIQRFFTSVPIIEGASSLWLESLFIPS